jgi:hypothetical protein
VCRRQRPSNVPKFAAIKFPHLGCHVAAESQEWGGERTIVDESNDAPVNQHCHGFAPTSLTTWLLRNVHHSSERKVSIPQFQNNVRNAVLSLRSLRASPCGTDVHISASDFSAHLPVRTRPTSSRAVMPPPCPFALSSPRSCTTLQYLLVRALAPPVCVVRQPIFQVRRSRMQRYRWVFVRDPRSIGTRELLTDAAVRVNARDSLASHYSNAFRARCPPRLSIAPRRIPQSRDLHLPGFLDPTAAL